MMQTKSRTGLSFITLLAATGLGLSVYLTWHYFILRIGVGTDEYRAFCDFSRAFNCSGLTVTKASELFAQLPLSLLAALWYISLLLMSVVARKEELRAGLVRVMALGSVVALITSIVYFSVMVVMKTFCPFCLGIDAVNIATFAVLCFMKPGWRGSWFEQWKTVAVIALCSMLATVALGKLLMVYADPSAQEIEARIQPVLTSPVVAITVPPWAAKIGNENAPIKIVEWINFRCSDCRIAVFKMIELLERYPHQIQLVIRNVPADASCNKYAKDSTRFEFACEGARVGICANEQGKFETVYESLLDNQLFITPAKMKKIALSMGVDENKFASCMSSAETAKVLSDDIEEAKAINLLGTPTFFVNGHRIDGDMPLAAWIALIDKLIAAQGQ